MTLHAYARTFIERQPTEGALSPRLQLIELVDTGKLHLDAPERPLRGSGQSHSTYVHFGELQLVPISQHRITIHSRLRPSNLQSSLRQYDRGKASVCQSKRHKLVRSSQATPCLPRPARYSLCPCALGVGDSRIRQMLCPLSYGSLRWGTGMSGEHLPARSSLPIVRPEGDEPRPPASRAGALFRLS